MHKFKELERFVYSYLEKHLPENNYYHNIRHVKEVVRTAEYIGKKEGLNKEELLLLKTAALLHDIGHIHTRKGHEEKSVEMAEKILQEYGYERWEIERIKEAILATRIPQEPRSRIAEILCDADVINIGTDSFFESSELIRLEEGREMNREWLQGLLSFLENHHFFTDTAKKEFLKKKKENMERVLALLEDMDSS